MARNAGYESERSVARSLDGSGLEKELRRDVDGEVRFDTGSRAMYATDASNYRQVPIGVVVPRTVEAVERTIALCRKHGAPIVNRGGGTALAGQGCNVAVLIDFSKYLNNILSIDPERRLATVEPGLILDDLRDAAEKHNLTFGPDPATHDHCTLGGMLGNNSCGVHSVMSGRTVDNVQEMEILTYDGERMRVGPTSEEELRRIIAAGGRRGEIYRRLRDLRDRYADLIRKRYPNIPRRVSGYNLDALLPENGFNVARALVGSESTCVTILEATLNLVHSPPGRALLVLGYPDIFQAGDHVPEVMAHKPVGLEAIDDKLVSLMKQRGIHPDDIELLPPGGGWLLAEFGGETWEGAADTARQAMETLRQVENPPSMKLFTDKWEEGKVWEVRESGLGATANVPGNLAWEGWEDAAIHPDHVGGYLRDFRRLLDEFGYDTVMYGHFGQGCIHCRINFDLFTEEGVQQYLRFIDRASDLVLKYGGSLSGEHGDGQTRGLLLEKMYGPELIQAMEEFKSIWDPDWRMNPGKVVRPYSPDDNLRLGANYEPWEPETHFKFPDDHGSFSAATLRCVGVGKCRRVHDAFMCPSFLATREEKDSTRGRARLLFEMFRGDTVTDGWRSEEVKESLDLCLACKGCKTDCPVNVDMATYKAEFLSHYYEGRIRPRSAYSMGLIGLWGRLGSMTPGLANLFSQAPVLSSITKAIAGVDQRRPMPKFARQTFTDWFFTRDRTSAAVGEDLVVVYPDVFNDYFFPDALKAAVRVLEQWGFEVALPAERPPAIRPLIHYGMLDAAKREIRKTLNLLRPFYRAGVPIVFLEPSTAAVFRDDLHGLFPNDEDGHRLARQAFLLSEFVQRRNLDVPRIGGRAILHAHCHQKAALDPEAARRLLDRMGIEVEEPQPGCCGMAGSFGFESGKYDISMQIGSEHLFPAIRQAPADIPIVADGFSCRSQIIDGTGREPMHMAQFLEQAFARARDFRPARARAPMAARLSRFNREVPEMIFGNKRKKSGRPEVVAITGASAGLGRAIAQSFAKRGAHIGLIARNRERLEAAKREVEELGGQAIVLPMDVTDAEAMDRAASQVEQTFGPIDVWVNNAMVSVFSPFSKMTPEEFKRVTEVTYLGAVYGTMSALRRMLARDRGIVVQVGSALAERSIPLQSAYCGAKHGMRGFSDSIRSELIHDKSNVWITMVQMPAMNTPQFDWVKSRLPMRAQPVPPIYQPEVGAEAVYWAAHHKRREVEVGWPTLKAMQANKFIPGYIDRYLASHNYEAQQTDEPENPNRPNNLYETVDGNYGAHGRFDNRSRSWSPETWASEHRGLIGAGLLGVGLLAAVGMLADRSRKRGEAQPMEQPRKPEARRAEARHPEARQEAPSRHGAPWQAETGKATSTIWSSASGRPSPEQREREEAHVPPPSTGTGYRPQAGA